MNHRIFERTLRSLVFRGACLFECHVILNLQAFAGSVRVGLGGFIVGVSPAPLKCISLIPCGSALGVIIVYAATVKRLASF